MVQEVRIYFESAGWYNTLYASHAGDPDDPYFPARFVSKGMTLDPIGVRFKGNSSFGINGVKKSFKLDFNEYDDDQTFLGLSPTLTEPVFPTLFGLGHQSKTPYSSQPPTSSAQPYP